MKLMQWKPNTISMFDEMDSIIGSYYNRGWNLPHRDNDWDPPVDVKELNDSYLLSADIPGLTRSDIKVNIDKNVLSISGEKDLEMNDNNSDYYYRERKYGAFSRTFNLPESIDQDKVSASFKNGTLEVSLPKHENVVSKDRKIKVS